jgi:hypothetical protein
MLAAYARRDAMQARALLRQYIQRACDFLVRCLGQTISLENVSRFRGTDMRKNRN